MTIRAAEALCGCVLCVTEGVAIRASVRRGPREWLLIVANSARSELSTGLRFTARRVTAVALIMSGNTGGNCQSSRTPTHSRMTRGATAGRPRRAGHVLSVIEFNIKAFIKLCRKILHRRIRVIHVCMTDHAHWNIGGNELPSVTTNASFVSGEPRRRGIITALMTRRASERCMALTVVPED